MYPDYTNSIVNLMASLQFMLGGRSRYPQLKKKLPANRHIVLITIDGMGYNFLMRQSGFLKNHCRQFITSTFPSTTAAAATCFLTGVPPQQHGLTGWYVYFKEAGAVMTPLPSIVRYEHLPVSPVPFLGTGSFFGKIKTESHYVCPNSIRDAPFNEYMSEGSIPHYYSTLRGFVQQIKRVPRKRKPTYTYAYWPFLDSMSHMFGPDSEMAELHFKELQEALSGLQLKNTTIIVTADHGFNHSEPEERIDVLDHPRLLECLSVPLCGEPRLAYCYVKAGYGKQFLTYVKTKLKHACSVVKSSTLLKQGRFGRYAPHPKLHERIGDYTLIMKGHYTIAQNLMDAPASTDIGNHGGVSENEMKVPLIVFGDV
jgi:hypothetical protein